MIKIELLAVGGEQAAGGGAGAGAGQYRAAVGAASYGWVSQEEAVA